jgi:hypothetical protein
MVLLLPVFAYLLIWNGAPTGDDWFGIARLAKAVNTGQWPALAVRPNGVHWSPGYVTSSAVAFMLDRSAFGLNVIRAVNAVALMAGLFALMVVGRAWRVAPAAIIVAAVTLVFHQASVGVLYQWDSLGPMVGDAFARCALALVVVRAATPGPKTGLVAGVLVFLALLFKETALGTAVASLVLISFAPLDPEHLPSRQDRARVVAAIAVACVLFVALRAVMHGPVSYSPDRYSIGGVDTWLKNIGALLTTLCLPISTLWLWDAFHERDKVRLVIAALATAAYAAWIGFGLVRAARPKTAWPLLASVVAALFPMFLMRHVSEVYLSSALFFFALVVMVAANGWFTGHRNRNLGVVTASFFVLLFTVSWAQKLSALKSSGREDARAANLVYGLTRNLPVGSRVWLQPGNPNLGRTPYSIFRISQPEAASVALLAVRRLDVILVNLPEADYWICRRTTKARLVRAREVRPCSEDASLPDSNAVAR